MEEGDVERRKRPRAPSGLSAKAKRTKKHCEISAMAMKDDGVAMCYMCHGGGVDDNAGHPLRRDCACRGTDAGFVHIKCLTAYAKTKSKQVLDDMDEFTKPWFYCPCCHQEYQNELAIDIASKLVLFVRRQYPDDTQRQVESLNVFLCAVSNINRLQPVRKREARSCARMLLSMIDRMKNESPLERRYSWYEASAHNIHGLLALDEGTKESARRAVAQFNKTMEVCEAINNEMGIAIAKNNIDIAKSRYEGGRNNEKRLKLSEDLYKVRVADLGEEHEYTINAGIGYAVSLHVVNRGGEARELLTKLLATSKQVLGPHHNITKEAESELEEVMEVANHD